jgi:hypothetical protein
MCLTQITQQGYRGENENPTEAQRKRAADARQLRRHANRHATADVVRRCQLRSSIDHQQQSHPCQSSEGVRRTGRAVDGRNKELQRQDVAAFYGSSFIAGPAGEKVVEADRVSEAVLTATFDLDDVRAQRHAWGVFRDRRPELYGPIMTLDGDATL